MRNDLRKMIDSAWELNEADRLALPPECHQPHWMGLSKPAVWMCSICWGDGWSTQWPCKVAQQHGKAVAQAGGLDYSW